MKKQSLLYSLGKEEVYFSLSLNMPVETVYCTYSKLPDTSTGHQ